MDGCIVEHFVHQSGTLPLHLEHEESWLENELWFKELVGYARMEYSMVIEGVWGADDTSSMITCITDLDTLRPSRLKPYVTEMKAALLKLKRESYLTTFCSNFIDGEYGDAIITLGEWVSLSLDELLSDVAESMPDKYHDEAWVVTSVGVVCSSINSLVQYKLEYRGTSNAIPTKTALALFIDECLGVAEYWGVQGDTKKEAADGAVFSMLNLLDGCKPNMPLMDVVLRPHPEDKAYHISKGEDYYVDGQVVNAEVMLHEEYCAAKDV